MKIQNRNQNQRPGGVGGRPRRDVNPYAKQYAQQNERRNGYDDSHHITFSLSRRTVLIIICCVIGAAAAASFLLLWKNGVFDGTDKTDNTTIPASPTNTGFSAEDMDVSNITLNGQKIIIDAAHTPFNPGNKTADGIYEEAFTLAIADKVRANLQAKGANVIMTRDAATQSLSDESADLAARYAKIRAEQADMVLSVHMNWYDDTTASGAQTFFREQGAKGKRIAVAVLDMLNYKIGYEKQRMPIEGSYEILGVGAQPSAVVECGFLSNPEEAALLKTDEYQQKIADAISDGILLYRKRFADLIEKERIEAEASDAAVESARAAASQAAAQASAITGAQPGALPSAGTSIAPTATVPSASPSKSQAA